MCQRRFVSSKSLVLWRNLHYKQLRGSRVLYQKRRLQLFQIITQFTVRFTVVMKGAINYRFASWNSQYLYDVSKNEDHSVDIILSPYGQSCVLLANPYDTSEVPMLVSVSVERSRFDCSELRWVFFRVPIANRYQCGAIPIRKGVRYLRCHSFLVSVSFPSSTTPFSWFFLLY